MKYTPTQALERLKGITRKRLYEMMKNGDLSYSNEDGKRSIDASELARVFGDRLKVESDSETFQSVEKKQNETQDMFFENKLLQQKIELLEERLKDKDLENKNLWNKFNEEAEERRKLTMMLIGMQEKVQEKPVERPKKFLGIFPWKF